MRFWNSEGLTKRLCFNRKIFTAVAKGKKHHHGRDKNHVESSDLVDANFHTRCKGTVKKQRKKQGFANLTSL